MKAFKLILIAFAVFSTTVAFSSCDRDDPATCTDGIQNGEETGIDCGGPECGACPTCTDGVQNGDETGVDCGGSCSACTEGVQGKRYQSSGSDVAPLLVNLFAVDSIYAEFNVDFTYTVEQYDTSGVPITLTGTYSQSESGTGTIYNITLDQSTPAQLTVQGIFDINGTTMSYEVVQTNPDIGATPPTAAAGFGSSNGGTLGTANVQTYQEIQ